MKKIHFIGIGGIGVSALAQYYFSSGHTISGSDLVSSQITEYLKEKGINIFIAPGEEIITSDLDLVIYSSAVRNDNPEYLKALDLGIKTMSYPEALGELTKKYFTIAVSGTHGKSTTCAMLSLILIKAGFDPTVIIGTKLASFGNSNFRLGKSKYLLIEADEWNASFLNYWPKAIGLTNIETEHLDYYRNIEHIISVYSEYLSHLQNGILVVNKDDQNISKLKLPDQTRYCSLNDPQAGRLKEVLKVPGEHNLSNALLASALAGELGIDDQDIYSALGEFKGSWRRFEESETVLNGKRITRIDDYGHHPTEIEATLKTVREKFPNRPVWCVFQPHQYARTHYLFDDFVRVLRNNPIDKMIVADIYDVSGRENQQIKANLSSSKLVEAVSRDRVEYRPTEKIKIALAENIPAGAVLLVLGAGDIYTTIDTDAKKDQN